MSSRALPFLLPYCGGLARETPEPPTYVVLINHQYYIYCAGDTKNGVALLPVSNLGFLSWNRIPRPPWPPSI